MPTPGFIDELFDATEVSSIADSDYVPVFRSISGVRSLRKIKSSSAIPVLPIKATGAEIDTGTDDANFVTAKALADSSVSKVNKVASANVRNSHDAEATHTGDIVYTKVKTITLTNGLIGAARFLFDLKTSNVLNTANGQIYRNGVALGTEQSDVTGVYDTKSEDITQTWNPGDTVELWVKIDDAAQTVSVRNFRLAYDDAPVVAVASVNS